MATARPFAYNPPPNSSIAGTDQVGSLAVGTPTSGFTTSPRFWNGPDEDLGYVVAHPTSGGTQPNPLSISAYLGFWRTPDFTDGSFIDLAQYVSIQNGTPQTFSSATQASTWLTTNGYWNSYTGPTGNRIMYWDLQNSSSYNGVGTTIYDLDSHSNGTLYNSIIYSGGVTNFLNMNWPSTFIFNNNDLNPYLNPPTTGNEISVFTWVYPLSNNGTIISEQGGYPPNGNWFDSQIELVSGSLHFRVWPSGGVIASSTLPLGDWSYVGFTYKNDGANGTLTGYINGVQVATTTVLGGRQSPGNYGRGLFYDIGGNCTTNMGSNTGFDGRFGALEVYNYGLTTGQVLTNYDNSKINYTRGMIMDLNATNSSSYNGSGSVWHDITENGNNGSIANAVYSAITGNTFYFNGTNAKVDIFSPLNNGTDYTISAWINPTNLMGARNIVSSQDSPFWIQNGTLLAGIAGNYSEVSYGPLSTNTWYLVSVTYNDATNTMKLYVNGSLVDTNTNVTQSYTSQATYIGAHFSGGINTSFFQGYISQVYLYDNEQTGPEVLHLYNRTKETYLTQFTISPSRLANEGYFGATFSNVSVNGFTLDNTGNNQLWPSYYADITNNDSDILSAFANASESTLNGTGFIWNVQWGPGSTNSTLAKVGYYANGKNIYMIPVDPSDPNWQNSGNVLGTPLVGTFNFPATFTVYVPPTSKGGWC